ncbi:hypothetical protein CC1G_01487 [Coprinopsis cinerea okayama7|uniref:Uncharacterized protein n=1 Tax=Coprinopsis cinerea (strain Okayama-7 / 130 / ATCC MYA-4618 / FGSC 9003) TaxID=240176 RepID=A8NHR5_COPC7|nr:hypothetical protein CC1G_01487 [Coprinopsis cinerea okayama7\|eukprot:XP_001833810.2 hypothetical protein CC1G_01487 [Coprinopsis cinerea okayama7\
MSRFNSLNYPPRWQSGAFFDRELQVMHRRDSDSREPPHQLDLRSSDNLPPWRSYSQVSAPRNPPYSAPHRRAVHPGCPTCTCSSPDSPTSRNSRDPCRRRRRQTRFDRKSRNHEDTSARQGQSDGNGGSISMTGITASERPQLGDRESSLARRARQEIEWARPGETNTEDGVILEKKQEGSSPRQNPQLICGGPSHANPAAPS